MKPEKIDLTQKLSLFRDHWSPKIIAEVDDCAVKIAKFQGDFVWHRHELEDELFLVLKGQMRIQFREGDVELSEGEMIVVPRGVEHRPTAEQEVAVLLFEPKSTLNTGDAVDERTVRELDRI